jgi:hypothetical protein
MCVSNLDWLCRERYADEFTMSPTNGNQNVNVESDLTSTPIGAIGSNPTATALYWKQIGDSLPNLYSYCLGLNHCSGRDHKFVFRTELWLSDPQ